MSVLKLFPPTDFFPFFLLTASSGFRRILGYGKGGELDTEILYHVCGVTWAQLSSLELAALTLLLVQ